ncbi:MAG: hypothetical protein J6Q68_05275 [Clostridia bacterium]|nr:hypothetical protein [Clostridia bacterium]
MKFLNGIRIGEYELDADNVIDEIRQKCIEGRKNYTSIGVYRNEKIAKETFVAWAEYMAKNDIYFHFAFSASAKTELPFTPETAAEIKKVAGEHFLGILIPELGSTYGCSGKAYGGNSLHHNFEKLTQGKEGFINHINGVVERFGFPENVGISVIEATSLVSYVTAAKTGIPVLETMCGDVENTIPLLRGSTKAKGQDKYINYVAHEWYGGVFNDDGLKKKRLRMVYDYSYMNGAGGIILESGDLCMHSHGMRQKYDEELPTFYRKTLDEFTDFIESDKRPEGLPTTKVAFVQGNLDGYSAWNSGSSLWNNANDESWGYSAPEFVHRIMNELGTKRRWCDVHNFGEKDFSGACGYGTYDIVNAGLASADALSQYDYLIFTGWNTMTPEIYENLTEYVKRGGILFMCAAHLNTSEKRNGEISLINNGDLSELFGCTLDAKNPSLTNSGIKFSQSLCEDIIYPADKGEFDPLMSSGYARYAKANLSSAKTVGYLSDNFLERENTDKTAAIIENKCGKGYAILLTSLDYPANQTFPYYRTVVRELLSASHRTASIKVLASDRVRFSVWGENDVYLLNTDFDIPAFASIEKDGKITEVILKACEIKHLKV